MNSFQTENIHILISVLLLDWWISSVIVDAVPCINRILVSLTSIVQKRLRCCSWLWTTLSLLSLDLIIYQFLLSNELLHRLSIILTLFINKSISSDLIRLAYVFTFLIIWRKLRVNISYTLVVFISSSCRLSSFFFYILF
jgi:hypothetical protein